MTCPRPSACAAGVVSRSSGRGLPTLGATMYTKIPTKLKRRTEAEWLTRLDAIYPPALRILAAQIVWYDCAPETGEWGEMLSLVREYDPACERHAKRLSSALQRLGWPRADAAYRAKEHPHIGGRYVRKALRGVV